MFEKRDEIDSIENVYIRFVDCGSFGDSELASFKLHQVNKVKFLIQAISRQFCTDSINVHWFQNVQKFELPRGHIEDGFFGHLIIPACGQQIISLYFFHGTSNCM